MTARPGAVGLVLAAALLALLTGCASMPEPVAPAPAPAPPVVSGDQASRILDGVAAVRASTGDPAVAAARVTGPQLSWLTAAPGTAVPAGETAAPSLLVAPRTEGWPRSFVAVVDSPTGPLLEVLLSQSPRDPYKLWASLPVLAGEVVPSFPDAALGADVATLPAPAASAPVASATGTPATGAPAVTVDQVVATLPEHYLGVLTDGAASPFAPEFAPDTFSSGVAERFAAEQAAVAQVADLAIAHSLPDGEPIAFSALAGNGDALVVMSVQTTTAATVRAGGGFLTPNAQVAALAGTDRATGSLVTTSLAALAFVVPAERGNIRVIAAAESLVGAQAS